MSEKKILIICLLLINVITYGQYTVIPDSNFEQELINQAIDSEGVLDGQVLTSDINTITNLSIHNTNINYMSGIDGFVSLTHLYVTDNENMTHLNLNNNLALLHLSCNDNLSLLLNIEDCINLEYLSCSNLSGMPIEIGDKPNLTYLDCSANFLSSLDISQCPNLEVLICAVNYLENIDVSQNLNLLFIDCSSNNITEIDLSNNLDLIYVFLLNNLLDTLDLNQNTLLEEINSKNNNLSSLYIQNGTNELITNFDVTNNSNLTCVFVDDAEYSETNWADIDNDSTFVETVEECESLSLSKFSQIDDFDIYPNPFTDVLFLNSLGNCFSLITIYDALGNKIISTKKNEIATNKLITGVYFIKIEFDNGSHLIKKIIKGDFIE